MATSSRFAVAVHVLTMLAWANDEPLKSEYIAGSVNTNPVVIRRILCALSRAGLVTSQTGATGGTRLARAPGDVTLRDVYRAIEPREIFGRHAQRPSRDCPVGMNIETILEDILVEVDGAVDGVLERMTIDGVLESVKPCVKTKKRKR
jgi:Rrf2 family protein